MQEDDIVIVRSVLLQRLGIAAGCAAVLLVASGFSSCNSVFGTGLGRVVVNPQTINIACPVTEHTFTVTQQNFSGTFTAVSADTTRVTVAPTIVPAEFVVRDGTNADGTLTIVTVTGGGGMTGTTSVTALGCTCVRHHDMWETCPLKSGGRKR